MPTIYNWTTPSSAFTIHNMTLQANSGELDPIPTTGHLLSVLPPYEAYGLTNHGRKSGQHEPVPLFLNIPYDFKSCWCNGT
ncbi:hypothetical protein FQR65_LT13734 [Abscondita terminalis]|nr:hypothetical protein FQR65_LT13734 [Abscondita terminalis]